MMQQHVAASAANLKALHDTLTREQRAKLVDAVVAKHAQRPEGPPKGAPGGEHDPRTKSSGAVSRGGGRARLSRMHRLVSASFAVGLCANGLFMLFGPRLWYQTIPNVTGTGPFNGHFVRDIGCAYLVAGLAAGWLALQRSRAWPAALAGGAFLGLHALVHLTDAAAGREPWGQVLEELPTVIGPAAVMLALAWPSAAPRVLGDTELETATEKLAP